MPKLKSFFGRGAKRGNTLWDYSQEYLVVIRDEKVFPFVKFGTILPLLCFLLDLLTKKPRRAWSFTEFYNKFMDRFQDISKIRNPENLEPSKANVLGHITLSHWPCFTWRFFMKWFRKTLKLICQALPSCPRNICTEHWKKLPNLIAFLEICLYLKNNDSVEHVQKVLLTVLFIYFKGKIKFSHCIWSIWSIFILI